MNIREHIEAGHYPTDDKGRALVPCGDKEQWTATICATDASGDYPIVGFGPHSVEMWTVDGEPERGEARYDRLLPPPPRKVKVTRWCWVEIKPRTGITECFDSKADAERHRSRFVNPETWRLVELTGEYEEPWQP